MSNYILTPAWKVQGLSPVQKLVLISLADQANDEGVCWPSVSSIEKRTCLSERSVRGAVKSLEAIGFISRHERIGRSTYYTVNVNAINACISCTPAPPAPLPLQGVHPTPAPPAPITIIEPSREPSIYTQDAKALDVFDYWKERMDHSKAKLDKKRTTLINNALKIGYTVDDLKDAIDGCANSDYHMGKNDSSAVYDDLSLILRDAGKIDGFIKKKNQLKTGAYNEISESNTREQQLQKSASGRVQLAAERELREIAAARQGGNYSSLEHNDQDLRP